MHEAFANLVLVVHAALVLFVVLGLVLIVVGNWLRWPWVNFWWFRIFHAGTIAVVVAESWLGIECPLTTLEGWLRLQAGQSTHGAGFIEFWLQHFLFYQGPPWAFTLAYSLFALVVLATWWFFPPVKQRGKPAA